MTSVQRIAIVGGGAAGLATAAALLERATVGLAIDVFDRRPTPFGMFRYGVAPDHANTRATMLQLGEVFDRPEVRFAGLVELGRDLSRADLLAGYDAVVYAMGADQDRLLDIPGEDLPGVGSGRRFAEWCAGTPGVAPFDLSGVEDVVVVGLGDVALDLIRLLLKDPAAWLATDMPAPVAEHLAAHRVARITVLVRRGPEDCQLKTRDLAEVLALPGIGIEGDPGVLPTDVTGASPKVVDALPLWREAFAHPDPTAAASLRFAFWHRPVAFLGDGRVGSVRVESTGLDAAERLVGSQDTVEIPAQLVLRATGARAWPYDSVPFDPKAGVVPTRDGRVVDLGGGLQPREYAVGWVTDGWVGGFGTQRRSGNALAQLILEDLAVAPSPGRPGADALLAERGVAALDIEGWRRIERAERERGAATGRQREKIADHDELVRIAGGASPAS